MGGKYLEKETFSLKEIILGTRGEYLKLQKLLLELKKMTITYDGRVKDFNYHLLTSSNKKEIVCLCKERKNLLTFFNYLKSQFNKSSSFDKTGKLVGNKYDEYSIRNKYYDIFVNYEEMPKFAKTIKQILESEFVNLTNFFEFANLEEIEMSLLPSGIYTKNDIFGLYVELAYLAKEDLIQVKASNGYEIDNELLNYLLNQEINKELFSTYHQNLITNDNSFLKPLEFKEQLKNNKKLKLKIETKADKVLLKK